MNQADLMKELIAAMTRLKVERYRDIRAMVLAFAAQESFIGAGNVSALAWRHHNPFGMKWNPATDQGRYEAVKLPGNKFDQADGLPEILYRKYRDFDHAVEMFLENIFDSGNTQRKTAFYDFVEQCADSWCKNNHAHVREVLSRFSRIRDKKE